MRTYRSSLLQIFPGLQSSKRSFEKNNLKFEATLILYVLAIFAFSFKAVLSCYLIIVITDQYFDNITRTISRLKNLQLVKPAIEFVLTVGFNWIKLHTQI